MTYKKDQQIEHSKMILLKALMGFGFYVTPEQIQDTLLTLVRVLDEHRKSDVPKRINPIVSYLCCTPKGSIHLGVDDFSGEARDCISQAKRMAERMTATGKERSFCLVILDGAQ